jgi:hypothetical protein
MSATGFKPAIPEIERQQPYSLDRKTPVTVFVVLLNVKYSDSCRLLCSKIDGVHKQSLEVTMEMQVIGLDLI